MNKTGIVCFRQFVRVEIMMLLALLFIMLTSGVSHAKATDVWKDADGVEWSYSKSGEGIMVMACMTVPTNGVVNIPSDIDGLPVKKIGATGFKKNSDIVELYIPDSVSTIFSGAFMGCDHLKKIRFPAGVEAIASDTFRDCSALEELIIPEGVKTVAATAFMNCESLKTVFLPSSVQSIVGGAEGVSAPFSKCSALEEILVDEKSSFFTSIDGVLFSKNGDTLVRYPEGKEDKTYDVPSYVKVINAYAFERAQFIECVIPEGIEEIPAHSFEAAQGLKTIAIPDSVKKIGNSAFYFCLSLNRVSLPSNLEYIGGDAFYFCHIKEVNIPKSVQYIGEAAFWHTWLKEVVLPEGVQSIEKMTFSESSIQYLYIPDSVTSIGSSAFRYASALKTLYIPASVASIDENETLCLHCDSSLTIYGESGSYIESYCQGHNLNFVAMTRADYEAGLADGSIPGASTGDGQEPSDHADQTTSTEPSSRSDQGGNTEPAESAKPSENTKATDKQEQTETTKKTGTAGTTKSTGPTKQTTKASQPTGNVKATKSAQAITGRGSFSKTTNSPAFSLGAKAQTEMTYTSSNRSVATVSAAGKVTITGPGTATISISAKASDKYESASRKVTVRASLSTPSLSAKNQKGRKVKLSWNKAKSADGYLIYVKAPGEKKFVKRLTKSAKVKSVTHKGLKKGKKYSYKIIAYKKVSGKMVYSSYSKLITVKVKK